jgi:hypothetical protein
VERREVLAAVIAAYPDSLRSLKQAQEMGDQVLAAAFTALPGSSGTSWIDTDRYRVPPALVTTSRQPVGWRDPRQDVSILDRTVTRARKQDLDQAQQLLPLRLPAPPLPPRRRRPVPVPRPDLDRVDQVELDLGLDPDSAGTPVDPFGEQLTIDVADGPPVRERHHGLTGHRALADQLVAAEADLQRAEAAAAAHDQQTRLLLAAVLEGRGEAATALRRRRMCLGAVAAMSAHATELLEQAREDRTQAGKERKLAARLRELAGRLWMSEDGKLEAAGLIREDQGDGEDAGDSGERPVSRKEVIGHAKRLEDSAAEREAAADSRQEEVPGLRRRARALAVTEHATVEAAELAEHFTDQQIQDQDAAAVAADTASTEQQRDPGTVRHRAAVDAARGAVAALRAERELRARMPADQRAREEEIRAEARFKARGAKQAAADKRAALRAQQERGQQGQNRGGGVR